MSIQFADVSAHQDVIDWSKYPFPVVAIKVSEGVGLKDPQFETNKAGALARGVSQIWYYHYARPDLGNSPGAEHDFFRSVLGEIRPQDRVVLDYEEGNGLIPDSTWCYTWLGFETRPILYSYYSFIQSNLQFTTLADYDLWLADYMPTLSIPAPWTHALAWQYTPNGSCSGITGQVDLNQFLGELIMQYGPNSADFTSWFAQDTPSAWTAKHTGCQIIDSNLLAYQLMSVDGQTLPTPGLPISNETYVSIVAGKPTSVQFFERGMIMYDPAHVIDNQPGFGASYLLKYDLAITIPQIAQLLPGIPTKIPDVVASDIRQLVKDSGI